MRDHLQAEGSSLPVPLAKEVKKQCWLQEWVQQAIYWAWRSVNQGLHLSAVLSHVPVLLTSTPVSDDEYAHDGSLT